MLVIICNLSSLSWVCHEVSVKWSSHKHFKVPRRHPCHMLKSPQHVPFNMEKQQLCFETFRMADDFRIEPIIQPVNKCGCLQNLDKANWSWVKSWITPKTPLWGWNSGRPGPPHTARQCWHLSLRDHAVVIHDSLHGSTFLQLAMCPKQLWETMTCRKKLWWMRIFLQANVLKHIPVGRNILFRKKCLRKALLNLWCEHPKRTYGPWRKKYQLINDAMWVNWIGRNVKQTTANKKKKCWFYAQTLLISSAS